MLTLLEFASQVFVSVRLLPALSGYVAVFSRPAGVYVYVAVPALVTVVRFPALS